ncbi:uncharacterized protein N7515_004036 [Penicillium bovifimosum]|uniref:Uncharacterized protein n=1 Tax=Penicillium bovifimosum TaxID=126998 RepID=A0A9W9H603_9EURO|nr:uncharacterized protein N7515_004036 [Penicillium bovifimosum]KAJ5139188.1 hypothetical protein N7515_004036 [Penicillium bovifimosum]
MSLLYKQREFKGMETVQCPQFQGFRTRFFFLAFATVVPWPLRTFSRPFSNNPYGVPEAGHVDKQLIKVSRDFRVRAAREGWYGNGD